IVVVDTGSTDGTTQEIAKKYADKFEIFTDCNDPETGLINSFSQARQRSFDLATQPWVCWADADDIVVGLDKLDKLLPEYQSHLGVHDGLAVIFPYEYSYDEFGVCTCYHYRERFFFNHKHFSWTNPVHEVVVSKTGSNVIHITSDDIVYKHQRQYSNKQPEANRNLRILKKYVDQVGETDARQFYYIGLEYSNVGMIDESIKYLTRYVDLSGWEDEVVMACLKLVDIYQALGQYEEGLKWAFKSIEKKENWGEGYFALARMFYFIANRGGPNERRNWERCVHFSRIGLSLPPTKTLLFVNPLDREYEIHRYLNMALNKIGDVKGALESTNTGLLKRPNSAELLLNKKLYEVWLGKQRLTEAIDKLKSLEDINQITADLITGMINKQIPQEAIRFSTEAPPQVEAVVDSGNPFIVAKTGEWTLPSTWDFTGYPLKVSDDQLQAIVIMIWKQYMLHDEILAAISFLENAPYSVRDSAATKHALQQTKACLDWMDDKADFQKVNAPINPEVEAGNPLPNKLIMTEGHRFDLVANRLKPNSSIVDFGCMDGCFTNRYGLLGHRPVGLDVCETSVKLANKKAAEFNTGAMHVCTYFQDAVGKVPNSYFEYATSTDTYEHLKDPVQDMLMPAKQMLRSDGKFLLATPHGSWLRGNYKEWAHPWLFAREGKNWLDPFARGHLVAPSVWSVAEHFRKAGYWVKDCFVDLCHESFRDVEGQGNIFAEAHVQHPKCGNPLDVVFYIGDGVEEWTPETVKKTGIGGSETAAIEIAKRLAAQGNRVRVFNSCGQYGEGIYDGVEYHKSNNYQDLVCDVLIVSRQANMLADSYNVKSKLTLLWVHDVYALNATNELLLKADRVLSLSQWHKDNLIAIHNLHPDHIIVTRNGLDLDRFNQNIVRDQYKCINSSSPDRSWPVLLDVWPAIKEKVPQASLHLYYGFKNWEYSAQFNPAHKDLINRIRQKIKELEPLGVVFHDRVDQKELAKEMLSAGCLLYPTWFTETFYITGAEALASGVRVISSPIAAINETVGEYGTLIPGEWTSVGYQTEFIKATVAALQNSDNADRTVMSQAAKEKFSWDALTIEWIEMFNSLIELKFSNPMVPYQPTRNYK
ncbi:MAG TPA: methyltransferase domain-containing protein, partial [Anaerovoracaceae bacterium]|nr:methyltransferase domain-containing protein [Anaerovoracaceae bacterium]